MKGIQYVIDEKGKKRSVMIDLNAWGELWEDFYDILVSKSRGSEPTTPWDQVKSPDNVRL